MSAGRSQHTTFKILTLIYSIIVLIVVGITFGYLVYLRNGGVPSNSWYTGLAVANGGIFFLGIFLMFYAIFMVISINRHEKPTKQEVEPYLQSYQQQGPEGQYEGPEPRRLPPKNLGIPAYQDIEPLTSHY